MYGLAMLHLVASIAKHNVTKVKCEFIRFCSQLVRSEQQLFKYVGMALLTKI